MATEAVVRDLLLSIADAIDAVSATAIASECARTANNYKAAANLVRAYINIRATQLDSYQLTDGKQATRVNIHQLRMMAADLDEQATSKSTEVADLSIAVERTGEDVTEFQDD